MKNIFDIILLEAGDYILTVGNLIAAGIAVFVAVLILWSTRKIMFRKRTMSRFDQGNLYALFQIIKYVVWVLTLLIVLESLGLKLNVLLAGSAALLVGVGLGLQDTFNNFISGLILLFEGSIKVGDILEVDGEVVKIRQIGLRTSEAMNRDDIVLIIPNSLITSNKVINWSHQSKKTRFKISVGVAYGSDVELVIALLKESAIEHPEILDRDAVNARFLDFGNSSLDFELLFFSDSIFRIENIKSDIRKKINAKFIENNITIPFPQMDVHIQNNNPLK